MCISKNLINTPFNTNDSRVNGIKLYLHSCIVLILRLTLWDESSVLFTKEYIHTILLVTRYECKWSCFLQRRSTQQKRQKPDYADTIEWRFSIVNLFLVIYIKAYKVGFQAISLTLPSRACLYIVSIWVLISVS